MKGYFVIGGCGILLIAWLIYGKGEQYCIVWPSIQTVYAKGFSEARFNTIRTGISENEVRRLLGDPLATSSEGNAVYFWQYSTDGEHWWFDWAWLSRGVYVRDGVVVKVEKRVYYD